MPGQPSQTGANKMLDALTGRATQTLGDRFIALCTSAPNDTALGTELVAGNGYARQQVTWTAPTGTTVQTTSNVGLLTFGPFTIDFANVTHVAMMEAVSGGTAANMLAYWTADSPRDPANGDSITIAIGALVMTAT